MHLTQSTDYALRVLLYLATRPDETVSAQAIAEAYGISVHHVAKVAKQLVQEGFVEGQRGQGGGLRLARKAAQVRVGDVVRRVEPGFELVECFGTENTCPIAPACLLAGALERARDAFMKVLDATTLADLVANGPRLVRLLPARTA
jgi:Rrf2 family nitric oxide-sensitive transcriptional repressor